MSSKGKSKRVDAENSNLDDIDDNVPAPAALKPKKKKKPMPPEPEEAEQMYDDEPEGEPEGELTEEQIYKRKAALSKKRKKTKLVGYRTLSKAAGYIDIPAKEGFVPNSVDCLSSLLSVSDAKRLMRFVPATPGAPGFNAEEFGNRLDLFKQSVPASAARETQARSDLVMRSAMNQAVNRAVETDKKTISASMMASVLRPYAANMEFTCVTPPLGLVRYGQNIGILNAPQGDVSKTGEEKKECAANKKAYNDFMESEAKRKAVLKEKKIAKVKKNAEAAAAAEAEVDAA